MDVSYTQQSWVNSNIQRFFKKTHVCRSNCVFINAFNAFRLPTSLSLTLRSQNATNSKNAIFLLIPIWFLVRHFYMFAFVHFVHIWIYTISNELVRFQVADFNSSKTNLANGCLNTQSLFISLFFFHLFISFLPFLSALASIYRSRSANTRTSNVCMCVRANARS